MKIIASTAAFTSLREGRIWTLLASDDAPRTLAIFQELFMGTERTLPQSVLLERVAEALDDLRARGQNIPQTAVSYVNYWRAKGWLSRVLRPSETEEEYSLTPEAATAVRFIANLLKPRALATESRLASVMHQVVKLAEDTDNNPTSRLETLHAERARIDQEIEAIGRGQVKALSDERALERAKEVLNQANELLDDFQNVRASFERLNQELRAHLLEAGGSRSSALEALFNGVDYIKNSEAGRSFAAFWRLLTDAEQSASLEMSIDALTSRRFASALSGAERRFLLNLPTKMFHEASAVQDVMHLLGASLNRFVRNEDPAKNRRLNEALQQAHLAALAAKDVVDPRDPVPFALTQTVPQIRSLAQYQLKDPEMHTPTAAMEKAEASGLSLSVIQGMIGQSEIDLRELKANIRAALQDAAQVSLADLLARFPATQGFGTVVGYITLGTKHGRVTQDTQVVSWTGGDGVIRSAELPTIYFTQDKVTSFHD